MAADSIEHEIVIDASQERVWLLLTEPEHVSRWFGDSTAADLRPGGALAFTWTEFGSHLGVVERIEPPSLFSYRWARTTGAEPAAGNSTRAEFTLIADGPRTRLPGRRERVRVARPEFSRAGASGPGQHRGLAARAGRVTGVRGAARVSRLSVGPVNVIAW